MTKAKLQLPERDIDKKAEHRVWDLLSPDSKEILLLLGYKPNPNGQAIESLEQVDKLIRKRPKGKQARYG